MKFADPSHLKNHALVHASEPRTFSCPVADCQSTFWNMSNLEAHQVVHTKAKPYACSICPMEFGFSGALQFHLKTHTGERQYICSENGCTFSAIQKPSLRKHIESFHTEAGIQKRKKKEEHFANWLQSIKLNMERNKSIQFQHSGSDNESCVYLDFYIERRSDGTIFIVEIDEDQHTWYAASCESMRPFKVSQALRSSNGIDGVKGSELRVVFVRMNPDAYKVGGKTKLGMPRITRYESFKTLYDTLAKPTQPLTVQYMYYDVDAQGVLECSKAEGFVRCLLDVCLPPIV